MATYNYQTYDGKGNLVAGGIYVVPDAVDNEAQLIQKAASALANNQTFLAIASPTTAQAVAQVKALTRQVNALIRLAVGQLDTTDGT